MPFFAKWHFLAKNHISSEVTIFGEVTCRNDASAAKWQVLIFVNFISTWTYTYDNFFIFDSKNFFFLLLIIIIYNNFS